VGQVARARRAAQGDVRLRALLRGRLLHRGGRSGGAQPGGPLRRLRLLRRSTCSGGSSGRRSPTSSGARRRTRSTSRSGRCSIARCPRSVASGASPSSSRRSA
jgi:hypothetical protein